MGRTWVDLPASLPSLNSSLFCFPRLLSLSDFWALDEIMHWIPLGIRLLGSTSRLWQLSKVLYLAVVHRSTCHYMSIPPFIYTVYVWWTSGSFPVWSYYEQYCYENSCIFLWVHVSAISGAYIPKRGFAVSWVYVCSLLVHDYSFPRQF